MALSQSCGGKRGYAARLRRHLHRPLSQEIVKERNRHDWDPVLHTSGRAAGTGIALKPEKRKRVGAPALSKPLKRKIVAAVIARFPEGLHCRETSSPMPRDHVWQCLTTKGDYPRQPPNRGAEMTNTFVSPPREFLVSFAPQRPLRGEGGSCVLEGRKADAWSLPRPLKNKK